MNEGHVSGPGSLLTDFFLFPSLVEFGLFDTIW